MGCALPCIRNPSVAICPSPSGKNSTVDVTCQAQPRVIGARLFALPASASMQRAWRESPQLWILRLVSGLSLEPLLRRRAGVHVCTHGVASMLGRKPIGCGPSRGPWSADWLLVFLGRFAPAEQKAASQPGPICSRMFLGICEASRVMWPPRYRKLGRKMGAKPLSKRHKSRDGR